MKVVLAALLMAVVATFAQPENNGVIDGRVTRRGVSERIAGAQITLTGPAQATHPLAPGEAPLSTSAITDSEGRFTFKNLPSGRYQLTVQREGYLPLSGGISTSPPAGATATVTVVDGQPVEVALEMLQGGIVSGAVRDPKGQPFSAVQVQAFQVGYRSGRAMLQPISATTTDDRGNYRLFWLAPGDYYLAVIPRRASPLAASRPQDDYARTFYPGVTEVRSASLIAVSEGLEASGIDLNVPAGASARISGNLTSAGGGSRERFTTASTVYLVPADSNALLDGTIRNYPNVAADRANGQFEIRGVPPGSYDLYASVQDTSVPGPARQMWGHARFSAGGADLENVALTVRPPVEVRIHLAVDGRPPSFDMRIPPEFEGIGDANPAAMPVPTPSIQLNLRVKQFATPFEGTANENAFSPPATFIFRSVPEARYTIQLTLPQDFYIADVRANGASVLEDGFDAGGLSGPIEVSVRSDGAQIRGVVLDPDRNPFPDARVVLVPQPALRENATFYKTTTSAASGQFAVHGVAPGVYQLFAWEAVPNTAWMNAAFMAPYESRGQTVTVTAGASAKFELKLIPRDTR